MPQLRSFSGFASTPDIGGSFVGGANVAAKLVEAKNELALGQQKIAASQTQANMELQAKRETLQAQAMRQNQELEMEKAYKDQVLGLKQRELQQADDILNLKAQEAARTYTATQEYQKEAEGLIAGGMDENKAFMQSALKYGPQMKLPGSAYTQAFKPSDGDMGIGAASDIQGLPNDQFKQVKTGPQSIQVVRLPQNMQATDDEMPDGYTRVGNKVLRKVDSPEVSDLKKERSRLVKLQDADTGGQMFSDRAKASDKPLTKNQKMLADRFNSRASEIRGLDEKISGGRGEKSGGLKAPEGAKEGQKFRSKKTGKMGIVRGGLIVPDEEQDPEEE